MSVSGWRNDARSPRRASRYTAVSVAGVECVGGATFPHSDCASRTGQEELTGTRRLTIARLNGTLRWAHHVTETTNAQLIEQAGTGRLDEIEHILEPPATLR